MSFIPLLRVDINENDISEVNRVLRTGMLVQGEEVRKLEDTFSQYTGSKFCIAASNGTATLHLALLALGIGKGDEVIVPAMSYVATANVVEVVGATTVFVDVDIETFNIIPEKIEAAITEKTKAIIPVHEFGCPADMEAIFQIAEKYKLKVIEDAACALGTTQNGKHVGNFGDIGSFSFHPRKAITSGEGGMLTTQDPTIAERFRILRNHGVGMKKGKSNFVAAGLNYRMTDFQAALVRSQFERLDKGLKKKEKLAAYYSKLLFGNTNLEIPNVPARGKHSWQTYHIVLKDSIDRDKLIIKLREAGIGTNYGAQCIPYQDYYLGKYKLDCQKLFPNAMRAYKQGLALPLFSELEYADVQKVVEVLLAIIKKQ